MIFRPTEESRVIHVNVIESLHTHYDQYMFCPFSDDICIQFDMENTILDISFSVKKVRADFKTIDKYRHV